MDKACASRFSLRTTKADRVVYVAVRITLSSSGGGGEELGGNKRDRGRDTDAESD